MSDCVANNVAHVDWFEFVWICQIFTFQMKMETKNYKCQIQKLIKRQFHVWLILFNCFSKWRFLTHQRQISDQQCLIQHKRLTHIKSCTFRFLTGNLVEKLNVESLLKCWIYHYWLFFFRRLIPLAKCGYGKFDEQTRWL